MNASDALRELSDRLLAQRDRLRKSKATTRHTRTAGLEEAAGMARGYAAELDVIDFETPVRVHLVQIENFDGLYLFADEDQAAEFAALFSEDYMQDGSAEVLDRAAGAQLIAEVRAELTVVDALPGAHPRSRPTV